MSKPLAELEHVNHTMPDLPSGMKLSAGGLVELSEVGCWMFDTTNAESLMQFPELCTTHVDIICVVPR